MNPKELLTKEYLEEEYINKNRSSESIMKELGIKSRTSFCYYVKKYNLYKNITEKYDEILTEKYLLDNYINQKKSIKEICKEIGAENKQVVIKRLKKFNIQRENRINSKSRNNSYDRKKSHPVISGKYFRNVENNAKTRKLEFNITIEEIYEVFLNQNSKCALSGLDLCFVNRYGKNRLEQTASLDRIDSTKGYTIDNIQWVHKNINVMKLNFSNSDFIKICELVSCNINELNVQDIIKDNKIPHKYMYNLIYGANIRDIEFNITEKYLLDLLVRQNYKCSLSGVNLSISDKVQTASLDRIDSSKGYVEGNVQWVEKSINKMKWNASQEEFINLCDLVHNHNFNNQPEI